MPGPRIEVEDDPTPLVRALRGELARRLEDTAFATLTRGLTGAAAVRAAATPEACRFELGDPIEISHVAEGALATATLDPFGRWDGAPIDGERDHPELAAWLRALASPPERPWREAAALFWAALEGSPGAPAALLVVELESGESERFGDGDRAYEIRAQSERLVALLEGRAGLIEEAFERHVYIRGSFPEISVLSGAALRVRLAEAAVDA